MHPHQSLNDLAVEKSSIITHGRTWIKTLFPDKYVYIILCQRNQEVFCLGSVRYFNGISSMMNLNSLMTWDRLCYNFFLLIFEEIFQMIFACWCFLKDILCKFHLQNPLVDACKYPPVVYHIKWVETPNCCHIFL